MGNKRAFTLIELLVAITITGILVTMGANFYGKKVKTARDGTRTQDVQVLNSIFTQYYTDYGEAFYLPPLSQKQNDNLPAAKQNMREARDILLRYTSSIPTDPLAGKKSFVIPTHTDTNNHDLGAIENDINTYTGYAYASSTDRREFKISIAYELKKWEDDGHDKFRYESGSDPKIQINGVQTNKKLTDAPGFVCIGGHGWIGNRCQPGETFILIRNSTDEEINNYEP